jgi:hypothetical protein
MPADLLVQIRRTAKETGLSLAEAMRQSMQLGLPKLQERLMRKQRSRPVLKPLTKAESRLAFGPDPLWDKLEIAMAQRPVPLPEED